MAKKEGNNTDSGRWTADDHEKVKAMLDEYFRSDVEAHFAEGGTEPDEEDCLNAAKGDIFRFSPEVIPVVLYFVLRFFLENAKYIPSLPLEQTIEFLDISEDGARLDLLRDAFDDDKLGLDALGNKCLLRQVEANQPGMRRSLNDETSSAIRAAKLELVQFVSAKQALAICEWLEFMRTRCGADPDLDPYLNPYIEGAVSYWRKRAASERECG